MYRNLVRQLVSGTPGTGTATLAGADTGYVTAATGGFVTGDQITYKFEEEGLFETGRGTYNSTGPTLSRDVVYESSAGYGVKASFTSAAKVSHVMLAQDANNLATRTELAFLFLRQGVSAAALLSMSNGVADSFLDATGVDAATSTGEVYDGTAKSYRGVVTAGAYANKIDFPALTGTTTNGVDGTGTGNYIVTTTNFSGATAWRFWDKTSASIDSGAGPPPFPQTIQLQFPSQRKVLSYTLQAISSTVAAMKAWTLQGSNDGGSWTTVDTRSAETFTTNQTKSYTCSSSALYTYYKFVITDLGNATTADNRCEMQECVFTFDGGTYTDGSTTAVNLVSNALAAAAVPSRAYMMVIAKSAGKTIVPNTDVIAKVSRNGGSTWATAVLTAIGTLADGSIIYETAAGVALGALSSGTSMKWRVDTTSGNDTSDVINITDVLLMWGN